MYCCFKCWERHANKEHSLEMHKQSSMSEIVSQPAIPSTLSIPLCDEVLCPICDYKPLVLHIEISSKILKHIEQNHLPLHCKKCSKVSLFFNF